MLNYDDEKLLIDGLKTNKMEYFTFHKTDSQPIKYLVKHIPTDIPIEYVQQDILEQKIPVTKVSRFLWFEKNQKVATTKLILTINKNDAHEINRLKDICHIRVDVELFKPTKRALKQCHRCLNFGHHSENCGRAFRCLRCGQTGHTHDKCTNKTKEDTPTCANCKGEHPANFKGCSFYKQTMEKIENSRTKTNTKTKPTATFKPTKQDFPALPKTTTNNTTTSTPPKQNAWTKNRQENQTSDTTDSLKEIFSFIKDLNISKIMTTIKDVLTKFRAAQSTMEKVLVIFDAVSNFF